ncbi:hypothetical protein B0T25DRAFT_525969 [Lasiosphaeria hispida]|uniref:Nucleotide exchange factor SIL1 n=1 Tax=Lasiosphaeria hispida TaxID=260671 RepID=A0AAJ0HUV4_9PEZI|nr:hypothetical protein B0T25DRAFT_525969 [Lasiosphaeria hispida]
MAKLRLRSLPLNLLALMGIILAGANASASPSPKESAPFPPGSPSGDVELICHTDNPAECYPKIFQAIDEFRVVRDDQDLPIGLHVRLDVTTGRKEAKINVPDEVNPALEGFPVDTSMVVIDQEEQEDTPLKVPRNAPVYDPAGKIKTPRSGEGGAFSQSLAVLKKGLDVDEALEMLEDISHDIYYGLKIAEDYDTVRRLFCLANTGAIFAASPSTAVLSRARLAALALGSAVQNNPKALAEIERHWPSLQKERCPDSTEDLATAAFRLVAPTSRPAETRESDPALAKVRISAISGMVKNEALRKQFLANGGMELLLEVLVGSDEAEWEPAQKKAAFLILDNFLDENMGAALGEWPIEAQAKDKECAQRTNLRGDCWDWNAKKLADRFKSDKSHWSVELYSKLKEQRKANGSGRKGKEEL